MRKLKILLAAFFLFMTIGNVFSFIIHSIPGSLKPSADSIKRNSASSITKDTVTRSPNDLQNELQNELQIDTSLDKIQQETVVPVDTVQRIDTTLILEETDSTLSNTDLFIYILLSVLGLGLFFFIFVINLFKTFHKKKSTRQSLLLSWSLFFVVSIIWIFVIWGLVAGFWTYASFMIVVIFLFIISLIMTIIAVKSR